MQLLIVALSALLIGVMVFIKIMHGHFYKKKYSVFKPKNINYYLRLSSFQWYVIRRVILFSLCVLAISWYIAFRYLPLFKDGVDKGWLFGAGKLAGGASQINYNKGWSMLLFLDLCTLFGMVTPLVLIFDRNDKWSLAFANLGILGACMTFFGSYPVTEVSWDFKYLLFGTWDSFIDLPVSFMIHFWMLGFSLYTFLWRRNWEWQDWIRLSTISFGYLFYVLIVSSAMGITSHATALTINDYVPLIVGEHAPYQDVIIAFGLPDNMWILAAFGIWAFFAGVLVILLPAAHRLVHHYTDVVKDNNYAQLYQTYPTNSFIRWVIAYRFN